MSFANIEVDLGSLPKFASVELKQLNPRYAKVVLGVALAFEGLALVFVTALLFAILVPVAGLPVVVALLIWIAAFLLMAFVAWFAHRSAVVIHYALRDHDVIVRSGVFWKKETVQPIRRIQHVEQHQGPVDKRFGLYELKLFSAGTGHFTFRIPGLDEDAASRIRQFILNVQQDGWSAEPPPEPPPEPPGSEAPAEIEADALADGRD